jgi:hypothetical protein
MMWSATLMTSVHQGVQGPEQALDVGEVQAGGGLVEEVQGAARGRALQLPGQLDALGLAPAERGAGLAQGDVAQAHLLEGLEGAGDGLVAPEEGNGLADRHGQHVGDGAASVADLEGLGVEALAAAVFAGDVHVGQELHLEDLDTRAAAALAAPPRHVEREAPGLVPPGHSLGQPREELTDAGEGAGVGGRVRARGAADGVLVDADDLVEVLEALEGPMGQGRALCPLERGGRRWLQDLQQQGGLSGAGDPGDHHQAAQGEGHVEPAEVVGRGAAHREGLAVPWAPPGGDGDAELALQVGGGEAVGSGELLPAALSRDAAALAARGGADLEQVIGGPHGLFVVLDHQHGVASITELQQGAQQALVVAGVQPDGGLVEDVGDPLQAAAHLGRQADALGLAAAEARGAAIDAEIAQAHIVQEAQAMAQLLQDGAPKGPLARTQLDLFEERAGLAHGHGHEGGEVAALEGHRAGQRVEAGALTGSAGAAASEGLEGAVAGEVPDALEDVDQALPGAGDHAGHAAAGLDDRVVEVGAVEHGLTDGVGLLLPGQQPIGAQVLEHLQQDRAIHRGQEGHVPTGHRPAGLERRGQGIHEQGGVEGLEPAQALALGAGALGGVEREQARLELRQEHRVLGAAQLRGEGVVLAVEEQRDHAAAHGQAVLEGLQQPGGLVRADAEAVHHDLDAVLLVAGQLDGLVEAAQGPVDAGTGEASGEQIRQLAAVLALALPHHGPHHDGAGAWVGLEQVVPELAGGGAVDGLVADGAVGRAQPRHQQAQVVEDLGDGAHGGARVAVDALLIDGQGGGEAVDPLHQGLLHLAQELPGVGRQGLEVAPLAFLVDGVEGQG